MKSFPKHKVSLFEDNECRGIMEVDCGVSTAKEFISTGSPFDDIRVKRMLSKAAELFEPTKITVVGK